MSHMGQIVAMSEVHKEALERYKSSSDRWSENRRLAKEDMQFRAGDHWPAEIKAKRELQGRPLLVVDKLNQYIRQVVNDGRQNRPGIKVRPIDDYGDEEIAEALQGLIRHICDRSNADEAFDCALEAATVGGFGFFRVTTDYAHVGTFNQDISVERIANPLSVLLGPFKKADASDTPYGFVEDDIPRDEYKDKFPNAKLVNWETDGGSYGTGWLGETVKVCEYWYKVDKKVPTHLLGDGTTVTDEDYQAAISNQIEVPPIIETRELITCEVKWCRMSGAEILEEKDWLGDCIPIFPVFGNEFNIAGVVVYSGLIRAAKDPQRLYNYNRSAFAESVALANKSPYVAAVGQVEDRPEWEDANQENYSVLLYNPVDVNGTALPQPRREPAGPIPEAYARDMQLSEHDIQASMGMYAASLGQQSNEKSGKAIMARQREGDTATFHYIDNLNRAVRFLGRVLVQLAPKIYDSRRLIRILGEDGESTEAVVDPNQEQPVMKMGEQTIYNLSVGTYDVSVSAGPSYTTKRQEAAEAMIQLSQGNPQMMPIIGDIMIRNMDWPGADEIADRLKLMLPPQILEAEQQKGRTQIPPEVQQAMQQAQQAMQQVQQAQQQIEQAGQQLMQEKQSVEAEKAANAAQLAKIEAASHELDSDRKVLDSRYQELSAKLDLKALQVLQSVPPIMPAGKEEPAINPDNPTRPPMNGSAPMGV